MLCSAFDCLSRAALLSAKVCYPSSCNCLTVSATACLSKQGAGLGCQCGENKANVRSATTEGKAKTWSATSEGRAKPRSATSKGKAKPRSATSEGRADVWSATAEGQGTYRL